MRFTNINATAINDVFLIWQPYFAILEPIDLSLRFSLQAKEYNFRQQCSICWIH